MKFKNQVIYAFMIIFLCHVTSILDTSSSTVMAVDIASKIDPRIATSKHLAATYSYRRNLKKGIREKKHIVGGRRSRSENEKPVRWGPVSLQNAHNTHSRLYTRKKEIVVRKDFVSMGDATATVTKKMSPTRSHVYRSAMAPRLVENGAI